jgi:hypothetical protein
MPDFVLRTMRDPFFSQTLLPIIAGLFSIIAIIALCGHAWGQHNHAEGHDEYKNWFSRDGAACCNKSDCGTVKPEDERIENGQHQIKVENKWCPIKPGMYLRTGKSPDWSSSHACVWPDWSGNNTDPCSRLKCYMSGGSG